MRTQCEHTQMLYICRWLLLFPGVGSKNDSKEVVSLTVETLCVEGSSPAKFAQSVAQQSCQPETDIALQSVGSVYLWDVYAVFNYSMSEIELAYGMPGHKGTWNARHELIRHVLVVQVSRIAHKCCAPTWAWSLVLHFAESTRPAPWLSGYTQVGHELRWRRPIHWCGSHEKQLWVLKVKGLRVEPFDWIVKFCSRSMLHLCKKKLHTSQEKGAMYSTKESCVESFLCSLAFEAEHISLCHKALAQHLFATINWLENTHWSQSKFCKQERAFKCCASNVVQLVCETPVKFWGPLQNSLFGHMPGTWL